MGNSSQNRTNQLLDQQRRDTQQRYNPVNTENQRRSNTQYEDAQSQIPGLRSRYQGYADTGGIPDSEIDQFRSSFGGGSSGGSSVANSLASGGGVDESRFGDTLKGYGEFASGGGGIDAAGIRARANSVIPSFYKNLESESSRRRLVNPYSPSFDAESAARSRQAGQQSVENVRNTELDISDKVNQNRLAGLGGLSNLQTNIADMIQRGKIAGGQQQISNAGLAESAASRRQAGEESILTRRQQGRMAGLSGLENQYQTSNQNAGQYQDRVLSGTNAQTGSEINNIGSRQNTTPWWQTALNSATGAAGAYVGAGGRFGRRTRGGG